MLARHSAPRQLPLYLLTLQIGRRLSWAVTLGLVLGFGAQAGELSGIDRDIAALKSDVAALSQTLFELEESVLYPADTQIAVFLGLKDQEGLELDSVELHLDGRPVASHLYTDRERTSLREGGIQRLYLGNLPHGGHELKIILTARSANERFLRREVHQGFRKRPGQSRLQLTLDAAGPDYEPVVSFQQWQ